MGEHTTTRSEIERIKEASRLLMGDLETEIRNEHPEVGGESKQLLKFHGVYAQDNRDVRAVRKHAGQPLEHIYMVRVAIPGGRLSADQYLSLDTLARRTGSQSLRLTTRQGIQLHFISKHELGVVISAINESLLTTWGGCGDVVRNVVACVGIEPAVRDLGLERLANDLSRRYKAPADAYLQLWIDGTRVPNEVLGAPPIDRSIYGPEMLPRKFKIAIATSADNCVDVLANDLGLVIDAQDPSKVRTYVGGGLGRSHSDDTTLARVAELLGEVGRDDVLAICDSVIALQREYGDRGDRSHARLKYLVGEWGIDRIRAEVERRSGVRILPITPDTFSRTQDHLGRTDQGDGRFGLGIKLPSGRIANSMAGPLLDRLRDFVKEFKPSLAITARGDIVLHDLASDKTDLIIERLADLALPVDSMLTPLQRESFACVGLPTCGLALAESERYLPELLEELSLCLSSLGVPDLALEVRITGCPNGCARPYLGEIGLVGRTKRSYDMYLGDTSNGRRLSALFAEDVDRDEIIPTLRRLLSLFLANRDGDERFGTFATRTGLAARDDLKPAPRRRRRALEVTK